MSRQKMSIAQLESVILAVWRNWFMDGTASALVNDAGRSDTDAAEESVRRASIILRDPLNREAILETLRDVAFASSGR